MSTAAAIHEGFMNDSRTILPRVGGGVGVGGGLRFLAEFSTHLISPLVASAIACETGELA